MVGFLATRRLTSFKLLMGLTRNLIVMTVLVILCGTLAEGSGIGLLRTDSIAAVTKIPEPDPAILLGIGIAMTIFGLRRRRHTRA